LLLHHIIRQHRNASVILEQGGGWSVGHRPAACGGVDTREIDPAEDGAEYSGGVEGISRGGAAGEPDGIGSAEGGRALGPVFWTGREERSCVSIYVYWYLKGVE
jgi:hypothetical protein